METIKVATTEAEIKDCFPVMQELRPQIKDAEEFYATVRRLQKEQNYRLAYIGSIEEPTEVVAVIGMRIAECLAWGKHMFVDDLVTKSTKRGNGYGKKLLDWARQEAEKEGCSQLTLTSGVEKTRAHAFYEREGMEKKSIRFGIEI